MAHDEPGEGTLVRRRVTVTATTRRILSTGPGEAGRARVPCPACGCEVEAVTPEEACALLRIEEETLRRLIDVRLVHVIRAVNGALWICRDSLFPGVRP